MSISNDTALERRSIGALDDPIDYEGGQSTESTASPFRKLHEYLAGRYIWAFLLGTIFAVGFAMLAYHYSPREYRSSGLIQFQSYTPRILYDNPDQGFASAFDAFVNNQVELMQSRRVIEMAMESETWDPYRKTALSPNERFLQFSGRLGIDRRRGGNSVWIRYTSQNPDESMHAVKAIVAAYRRIYEENNVQADSERLRVLEQRRSSLSNQLQSLRERILNEAREYGVDGLEQIHKAKVRDLSRVETQLNEVRIALALSLDRRDEQEEESDAEPDAEMSPDDEASETLTPAQLALRDNHLAQLLEQQARQEQDLERLKQDFGPQHTAILKAQDELSAVSAAITRRAEMAREQQQQQQGMDGTDGMDPTMNWSRSVEELRIQEQRLQQRYQQLNEEVMQTGRRQLEIERMRDEMRSVESKLDETHRRLDQLNIESTVGGRMNVVTDGDPGILSQDRKRKLAGVGVAGGMFLGFAIMAVIGSFDPRIRRSEQMQDFGSGATLLGILPTLPEDMTTGEAIDVTRHSVHHIRTMLQVSTHTRQSRVLTITGPMLASGKTSLTIALGLSYAAGGGRTLLIDGDLGSGAMTHSVDRIIRRHIGEILVERGMVSQSRIDTALHMAREQQQRLGEVLVAMGDLQPDQITEALAVQESSSVGLMDAISGKPLSDCTVETGVDNLFILPIGDATVADTPRLSPAGVQDLLQRAADQFDLVLIDVGPTPGGSQGALFTAHSDSVVLVVSRGDNRERTRNTIDFLHGIGAHVAGLVFNRASIEDVERSVLSSQSQFSQPIDSHNGRGTKSPGRKRRLGPMAHAVGPQSSSDEL